MAAVAFEADGHADVSAAIGDLAAPRLPMTRVRGVIFDFGGVLWNMRWDVARDLERAHDLPDRVLFETLYHTPTWEAVERGQTSREVWLDEAHRLLEAKVGRPLPRLHDVWRGSLHVIEENVALARALRPPYRTAILSNADASLRQFLEVPLGIHDVFDTIVASAEEGIAKPEPAIYRLAAERLALPIEACVFVDDSEPNVLAAIELGMQGVVFRVDRGDDLRMLLARLGVAPVR